MTMTTPYKFYVEIQIPELEDFECANEDTRAEAETWARDAEARWPGCNAVIVERKPAGNGEYIAY